MDMPKLKAGQDWPKALIGIRPETGAGALSQLQLPILLLIFQLLHLNIILLFLMVAQYAGH
ncbi:MAG: hypothetical protein JWR61_1000 [Ferruginibacter sp.]|nr:hypothetical protein [Ferruginibacter sp.]